MFPSTATSSCSAGSEVVNLTLPSYTLVVSPTPSIRLAASPANGADVGQGINLSVALAGGRAPFLYQWSGLPMGCAPSGTPWINCTAQTMGLSLVGVNATDSNGVSLVRTLLFTVSPALTTSVTTTSTLLDVGQTVTFGATVAGGTGTYTFDWSGLLPAARGPTSPLSFALRPGRVLHPARRPTLPTRRPRIRTGTPWSARRSAWRSTRCCGSISRPPWAGRRERRPS